MNNIVKKIILLILCVLNTGCWYCSTRVSEIGLRGNRIKGSASGECTVDIIAIKCYNYYGINMPYSYSLTQNRGEIVDSMEGNWQEQDRSIKISYGDNCVYRPISDKNELLTYGINTPPERRWWGYPSQALILPAFAIDIVTIPFLILALPFEAKSPGP